MIDGVLDEDDWKDYIETVNLWQKSVFNQEIIWSKNINKFNTHGEDTGMVYEDIPLKCLIQYNYFRSWPINQEKLSGEVDKQSCMIYLNKEYLADNCLLNEKGNFVFNPSLDRFMVEGIRYKPSGESNAAQADGSTLVLFIVLKREELGSSENRY